jgi:RNA polymerase sigma-70 factor, ECF subfamily
MDSIILEDIIKKCKVPDRKAQHQLYEICYTRLYNVMLTYIKEVNDRDWVFNMGMLKVYNSIDTYQSETNFLAWARTIMVRNAIDHIRNKSANNALLVSINAQEEWSDDEGVEDILDALEMEYLLEIINKLPDQERIVFNLYEIEGYKHKEIEDITGINQNTSKWLLTKARVQLRSVLSNQKIR